MQASSKRLIQTMSSLLFAAVSIAACSKFNTTEDSPSPSPAPAPAAAPAAPTATAAPAAPAPSTQTYPLATYILDKPVSPNALTPVKLTFAVTGGAVTVTINDFRFECKREDATTYSACPDGDSYTFSSLQSGTTYSLSVQAVSVSTGNVAAADSVSFTQQ